MRKRKLWGDTWHLDEVFCRINGQVHYLCVLWIKMVKYWTYWFSINAINQRQTDSFANSRNKAIHQGKSSPTNWPAIAHHAECISHWLTISRINGRTTEQKTHIKSPEYESARCGNSSLWCKHKDSSVPWVKSMTISKWTDTKPPQLCIELRWNAAWIHGIPIAQNPLNAWGWAWN